MQMILQTLDRVEILRYLGYRGQEIPDSLLGTISRCMEQAISIAEPKFRYQRFIFTAEDAGTVLSPSKTILAGDGLKKHLNGCRELYLLAVTLGLSFDRFIHRKMISSPDEGVILDACGTAAVEQLADYACREIAETCLKEQKFITTRFSPGYGDLPLESQRDLLHLLDTHRKIGLSLNESLLMTPSKSVSAIVGVTDSRPLNLQDKCEHCAVRETCAFRKRGTKCQT